MIFVLDFKKLTLDCISVLRPYFVSNDCRICDCTIGGTFLWRDFHGTEYTVSDGMLFLKMTRPIEAFSPPRGSGVGREAFERIIEDCSARGIPARLCSVSATVLERVLKMFPHAEASTDRAWSDYLYSSEDMKELSGRKFAGQRNHINRFMREYPAWSFKKIDADNSSDTAAFIEKFAREYDKESSTYMEANKKSLEALYNLELYGQFGGVLYVGERIVGMSLGEILGDTLYIHVEKADTAYNGSYPMLVNQFARMFATDGTVNINREEDDGIEGLRTSKMSYHPIALLEKYVVDLK